MSEKSPNKEYEDVAKEAHTAYIPTEKLFSQQINCKTRKKGREKERKEKKEREREEEIKLRNEPPHV